MSLFDSIYRNAKGLGEFALQTGTSYPAQLGGGLAYIPAMLAGGDKAGQAAKQAVEQAYTYQPRTAEGQAINQAIGGVLGGVLQQGQAIVNKAADAAYQSTGSPVVGAAVKTMPAAIELLANRAGAKVPDRNEITAYHGSPHDFDQFDISKIGTGEGAQAYGHGLYFAESPDVANEYKNFLGKLEIYHNGNNVGVFDESPSANAAHQIRASGGDVQKAINRAGAIYSGKWRDEVIDSIKKLGPGDVSEKVGGRLYTVDIADDAVANFLDWDKPLSQQPQAVRDALSETYTEIVRNNLHGEDYLQGGKWIRTADIPGQNVVGHLLQKHGGDKKAASDFLYSLGIPGIRYLDQGSRSGGKGTSNFVVFDDKLVKTLKKE